MKTQLNFSMLRTNLSLFVVLTILLGIIYPLFTTAISQMLFHKRSSGSLIEKDGKIIGSELLGQEFTEAKYFWGRLSAVNYDAKESAGSNLSPANPILLEKAQARIAALHKADPENKEKIPVDLITASASGLDPHISLAAAKYQASRIAKARNMKIDEVQKLIAAHIDWQSQIFGNEYVNVLELNLALDEAGK